MTGPNAIKCRFCNWTTVKFSKTSTPAKAFARLQAHIGESHWQAADEIEEAAEQHSQKIDEIIDGMESA